MIEPEYLAEMLGAACDVALVVTSEGIVASLLGQDPTRDGAATARWENQPMEQVLTPESIEKFQAIMTSFQAGGPMPRNVELNHHDGPSAQFPVRYSAYRISSDDVFLMLGQNLLHVADAQQQLVQAQVALERGYEERRDLDARYRLLLSATRDAFVVLSAGTGRIRDLNVAAASLLGAPQEKLVGSLLADQIKPEDSKHAVAASDPATPAAITCTVSRTGQTISVTRTSFRVGADHLVLCRFDASANGTPLADPVAPDLTALFRAGTDGIAFTSIDGVIRAANEAFLDMVGAGRGGDLLGRNLSGFLLRGQLDFEALRETALKSGRVRYYATWLTNDLGGRLPAEISVTYLADGPTPSLAFVIRDASQAGVLRPPASGSEAEAAATSSATLVGQAPLKEIVAATSDVVEKMCIETALDLTRNNRAAAADLLGLSRQSLYLKLRKHGILDTPAQE